MNNLFTCLILIITFAGSAPALAEWQPLQPDFTFKRVPAPAAGTVGRITIQIDPDAPRLPVIGSNLRPPLAEGADDRAAPSVPLAAALPAPSGFEWFWSNVPSSLDGRGAARLNVALSQLGNPPQGSAVPQPRLQGLQDIASRYGLHILRHTVGTQVSPALVLAVISVESGGRSAVVSSAGAQGLMQLMPDTAIRFGVNNSFDASENIRGGVDYLEWLMTRYDNDPLLVLAGYNAGEGNVARHEGVPPFAETRAYVPKVLAAWQVAKGLCLTPPDLITDACVFNVNGS